MRKSFKAINVVDVRLMPYDILSVTYSNGNHASMDAVGVAKDWLTMSNDEFYEVFGFNWIPSQEMQKKAREMLKNEYIRHSA